MAKLTSKTAFSGILSPLDLIHIVDVSNTTDNAAGSSFKLTLLQLFSFVATGKFTAYATGGQANATQLTAADCLINTVATDGDSALMPLAIVGAKIKIRSGGVGSLDLFPRTGENFIGLAANIAIPMATGTAIEFVCFTTGEWQY